MAKRTRAEMKAEPLRKVEAELDAVLDWEEANARPNLRQIEEVVLKYRREEPEQLGDLSGDLRVVLARPRRS